jgi:hypothetical protein
MASPVSRILTALALVAAGAFAEPQLNPPPPEAAPPVVPAPAGPSIVVYAQNPAAMHEFQEDRDVTKTMVDSLVRTLTGKTETTEAWRSMAGPDDRFGIKVTTAGGPLFSTRRGVVAAVISGLRSAGVKTIFVWDKESEALRANGFTRDALGCEVRGIDPPRGWDRTAEIQSPVPGRLIWGDAMFAGIARDRAADPFSSKSHLPTILTKDVTKFINVAALSDEPGCGVAGTLHSAVIGNLDNWRRFTGPMGGAALIPDCYADARLGGKCVLHILDALAVTYAGGPGPNPYHSVVHGTLYAGRDPVALDATGLRLLEKWRSDVTLPAIGPKAAWLKEASIGHADEKMIQLKPAR